jgi:hypothetical protein
VVLGLALIGGGAYAAIRTLAPSILPAALGGGVETETYTNEKFGFSIDSPKDWKVEVDDEEYLQMVSFIEPVGDVEDTSEASLHYALLAVQLEDSSEREYSQKTETEYFDQVKRLVKQFRADETQSENYTYEVLSSEETTINGNSAYKVVLKATDIREESDSKGEHKEDHWLYVFVDEKTQYLVRLTFHQSETAVSAVASNIINSFKVL